MKESWWQFMDFIRIILHIAFLYLLLFFGNAVQTIFQLSIPGSVLGMLFLFFLLKSGIVKLDWIKEGTSLLLKHLTLFFIPVTVGFMEYLDMFSGRGILLLVVTILSTALVMGLSGFVSERLVKRKEVQQYE